ncbi:hypothetical protein LIA77_00212 [Sarocladium implicatum]|nr:hypothetical protein LIA77_00212 [Sarocladium implicatum]
MQTLRMPSHRSRWCHKGMHNEAPTPGRCEAIVSSLSPVFGRASVWTRRSAVSRHPRPPYASRPLEVTIPWFRMTGDRESIRPLCMPCSDTVSTGAVCCGEGVRGDSGSSQQGAYLACWVWDSCIISVVLPSQHLLPESKSTEIQAPVWAGKSGLESLNFAASDSQLLEARRLLQTQARLIAYEGKYPIPALSINHWGFCCLCTQT